MSSTAPVVTYYTYDLLTGSLLGTLPFRGVKFSSTLNGGGRFEGGLELTDPRLNNANPLGQTTPNKTVVVVDLDGAIVWSGIILTRRWQVDQSTSTTTRRFAVQAVDCFSYFAARVQATDYSAPPYSGIYVNPTVMPIWDAASSGSTWDPMLIAGQVVSDALSYSQAAAIPHGNPLGGINILYNFSSVANYLASGTATPAASYINTTYPFTTLQTVDSIVTSLSGLGLGVGFDFAIDMAYSGAPGSPPRATLNLSYPRRGRAASATQLVVDLTKARSYEFPEDGTQTANQVYETGGSGAINVTQNIFPQNAGYALFERVFSRGGVTSANIANLLAQFAYTDLYQTSYAPVVPRVTLDLFTDNPKFGSFITGDQVMLTLPTTDQTDGLVYDPRFPSGLNQEWRITDWEATVADEGDSTLALTLNQPPVLSPIAPAI